MKASLAVASLFALMLASPCMAGTDDPVVRTIWERDPEPAPPMTVTRIDGKAVDPLIAFLEAGGNHSMLVDVVMVTAYNIHSSVTPPPPSRFDRAYPNAEIVFDLPGTAGTVWGLAEIPTRRGGKCVIHLAPIGTAVDDDEGGIEILDQVALPSIIRHEHAHCNGAIHPGDDPAEWVEVPDADRAKIVAITRQTLLELTGQDDAAPVPARTTSPPKPQRVAPGRGPCMASCGY